MSRKQKILRGIKTHKRRITQVVTALLYNSNFTGFVTGTIYQGDLKMACVPGLNCYSCPGAIGACPLGSLQSALVSFKYRFPYYILGLMLLMGVLLARFICGFLCPFGFIQEMLYKIPTKKIGKNRITSALSYLKYILLVLTVVIATVLLGAPWFCKFICPAGTLEAGIPLVIVNSQIRAVVGALFSWKVFILVLILVSAVFCFRSFCRFLCPLGAFYALFNRIAVFRMEVDSAKCDSCGACKSFCKLDIKKVGDRECVQCGDCRDVCPQKAISRKVN